jgi:hypothetical protein
MRELAGKSWFRLANFKETELNIAELKDYASAGYDIFIKEKKDSTCRVFIIL